MSDSAPYCWDTFTATARETRFGELHMTKTCAEYFVKFLPGLLGLDGWAVFGMMQTLVRAGAMGAPDSVSAARDAPV